MEEELRLLRSSTGPGMFFPGPVDDQVGKGQTAAERRL